MSWFRAFVLACCLAALAACGFRPLHATYRDGAVNDDLATIYVASIADRVGQQVRNELVDLLNPKGVPANNIYRLEVQLSATSPPSVLSSDELASRRNYRLNAHYQLTSADGKSSFLSRRYLAVTSFDIVSSEFATLAANDYAQELAAKQVAEEIATQLTLYFTSKR
ncbi:MAG: hypothetical protein GY791_07705 [Alphaproteobacteria bacterium]|nr:hypothetical protein [Alphaproteobacteria bacterium]